jgi:hypothetical protein
MDIAGHVSRQMLALYSRTGMEAKRKALEAILENQNPRPSPPKRSVQFRFVNLCVSAHAFPFSRQKTLCGYWLAEKRAPIIPQCFSGVSTRLVR